MANPHDRGFNTVQNSRVAKREQTTLLQKYTLLGVAGMAVLAVAILVVMAVGGIVDAMGPSAGRPDSEKPDWSTFTVTASDTLRGDLVLVNATHAYTFPETEDHLAAMNDKRISHSPRIYQQSGLSTYMDSTALDALDRMLVDFNATTGKDDVTLRYAYRSAADQQELIDKGSASVPVGHSDHHTGLGIQLGYYRDARTYALSTDPVYNWLFENCHKYGFVIRYPDNKTAETGVEDYNEYFRYVGVAHATYMKENDLCMEEYVELLKGYSAEEPLAIKAVDGKYYEVYYVAVDGSATVKYPTNYAYSVSGTNEGGVVITVDRSKALTSEADTAVDTTADTTADTAAG